MKRKFRRIADAIEVKLAKKAQTEALRPVMRAIRAAAPKGKGELRKKIAIRRVKRLKPGEIAATVVRVFSRQAVLVERGTKARRNSKGANRGHMTAQPFAKPAAIRAEGQALEIFRRIMAQGLAAEV